MFSADQKPVNIFLPKPFQASSKGLGKNVNPWSTYGLILGTLPRLIGTGTGLMHISCTVRFVIVFPTFFQLLCHLVCHVGCQHVQTQMWSFMVIDVNDLRNDFVHVSHVNPPDIVATVLQNTIYSFSDCIFQGSPFSVILIWMLY